MLAPEYFYYSFQHRLSKEQYRPVRVELRIELLSEVQRKSVSPSPVLYATDSLKGPQFCMHLVVKINV